MIYEIAGKNEQLTNIFKEGIVHIDDALGTKLLLYKKDKFILNRIKELFFKNFHKLNFNY